MSHELPCLPAEPEISGIGVRVAIYVQNLLSFIPAISALADGEVATYELDAVRDQSATILITAFGILISAMVQTQTLGLSGFHANIVLYLSWMNNTNTFIYFLLYVQHKSQLGPHQIRNDFISWINHIKAHFSKSVTVEERPDETLKLQGATESTADFESADLQPRSILSLFFRVNVRGVVALLGSLHLSMMSALGIWVWSRPLHFGIEEEVNACALNLSSLIVVGRSVPLSSPGLRIWSLIIYSTLVVPGLNLLGPFFLFILIVRFTSSWRAKRQMDFRHARRASKLRSSGINPSKPNSQTPGVTKRARSLAKRSLWALQMWYNPLLLPTVLGLVCLFAINIIFIVSIEVTLRQNSALIDPGESDWTFGQTLALLMLVLPLRDLRVFGARKDVSAGLRNAVNWQAHTEILWDLVRRGADVNVEAEGAPYPTALLLAVKQRRDAEFTRILLSSGANPDIPDSEDCTALQAASANGDREIVKLLLAHGANPNLEGGQYGTALQAAAAAGHTEIVKLLLEHGADASIQGGRYGSALQAAAASSGGDSNAEIMELLQLHPRAQSQDHTRNSQSGSGRRWFG
ncbi:hypothetical protein R3P38DRAFT_2835456 [Favolaschia claudopus]|uniref:Uncharacterized protein n=1 Tax=Favolaschia claudopus TaxID=2862362 RepID=A0AAW0EBR4_9AGAR